MVFDWKIAGKKLAKNIVYVLVAGIAVVYFDNTYYLALVPAIKAIENTIRHW